MKIITREVTMYSYTFANIDLVSGKALNIETVTSPDPLTKKDISAQCASRGGALCIASEVTKEKYSLPLSDFVAACMEYAAHNSSSYDNESSDSEPEGEE